MKPIALDRYSMRHSAFLNWIYSRQFRWPQCAFFLLLLCSASGTARGQETTDTTGSYLPSRDYRGYFGPLIGIHPGEHLFLEAGFGFGSPLGDLFFVMRGIALSVEVKPDENVIVAPRVTAWFTFIGALGLGAGYYTDFDGGTFVIQPEVGVGLLGGRVTWRINLPLGKEIEGLNTNNLSVSVFLPVFQ